MTKYKVRAKGCPDWRNYKRACLAISVGKVVHEGAKLEAAVEWIGQHFESCVVDLSDTLQRWNFLSTPGMTLSDAHAISLYMGDNWLARNKPILEELSIPCEIIRWDHWLRHQDFGYTLEEYRKLYKDNERFRDAIDFDAETFLMRRSAEEQLSDGEIILSTSRCFVLEEIAAHTLLNRSFPAAKIYPGHSLESLRIIREGHIPGAPQGLEQEYYTRVHFDRLDNVPDASANEIAERLQAEMQCAA